MFGTKNKDRYFLFYDFRSEIIICHEYFNFKMPLLQITNDVGRVKRFPDNLT